MAFDKADPDRNKKKKCEELMTPEEKTSRFYEPVNCELEMKPLTFPHILPHMIVLGIGLFFGTLIFLIEICFKKG